MYIFLTLEFTLLLKQSICWQRCKCQILSLIYLYTSPALPATYILNSHPSSRQRLLSLSWVAGSIPSGRPWSSIFRNWSRLGLKMYIFLTLQFIFPSSSIYSPGRVIRYPQCLSTNPLMCRTSKYTLSFHYQISYRFVSNYRYQNSFIKKSPFQAFANPNKKPVNFAILFTHTKYIQYCQQTSLKRKYWISIRFSYSSWTDSELPLARTTLDSLYTYGDNFMQRFPREPRSNYFCVCTMKRCNCIALPSLRSHGRQMTCMGKFLFCPRTLP